MNLKNLLIGIALSTATLVSCSKSDIDNPESTAISTQDKHIPLKEVSINIVGSIAPLEAKVEGTRTIQFTFEDPNNPGNIRGKGRPIKKNTTPEEGETTTVKYPAVLILRSESKILYFNTHVQPYRDAFYTPNSGETYWVCRDQIEAPEGLVAENPNSATWKAMLVVGGTADLSTSGQERIKFTSPVVEVDLSNTSQLDFNIEIPYATDWFYITPDANEPEDRISGQMEDGNVPHFHPLGNIVTYTLTNNMNQETTVEGLTVKSNDICNDGYFDISSGTLPFSRSSERIYPKWKNGDDKTPADFREFTYRYTTPQTLAKGQKSTVVFVAWYHGSGQTTYYDNPEYPKGINNNAINGRYAKLSAIERYPVTHVYPLNPTANGQKITKPNYAVVPIMGTNLKFSYLNGHIQTDLPASHSILMNCELYEQPNMILGYFSKHPIISDGNGGVRFAPSSSKEDAQLISRNLTNGFADWSKIGGYDLYPGQVAFPGKDLDGKKWFLPDPGNITALGINPPVDWSKKTAVPTDAIFLTDLDQYFVDNPLPQATESTSPNSMHSRNIPKIKMPARSYYFNMDGYSVFLKYRVANSHKKVGGEGQAVARSPYQAIYRVMPENSNEGSPILVQSVYVGKYYSGSGIEMSKKEFWDKESNLLNKVERVIPLPGIYTKLTRFQTPATTYSQPYSELSEQGNTVLLWTTSLNMDEANSRTTRNAVLFHSIKGNKVQNNSSNPSYGWSYDPNKDITKYIYQMLIPYSSTYVGDSKN